MASTYSMRFRLNYQAPGDNLNAWGSVLNAGVFQLMEDALAKRVAFTLSGTKTLTSALGSTDEARCAFLDVTGGSGGTIIIPSVEKWYLVRNSSTGVVIVTTGSGTTVALDAGSFVLVMCDATNLSQLGYGGYGLKEWIAAVAFATSATMPAQLGNAGKFIRTDGVNATWQQPSTTDLSDYATKILGVQVALAVSL